MTKCGGNLPVVLKNILNGEDNRKEFLIYFNNMLPYILLISRGDNGFSEIKKVIDNDIVKAFIDELGVDSVFVNDYLALI